MGPLLTTHPDNETVVDHLLDGALAMRVGLSESCQMRHLQLTERCALEKHRFIVRQRLPNKEKALL